jgi:hypothetical protein
MPHQIHATPNACHARKKGEREEGRVGVREWGSKGGRKEERE